MHLPTLTLDYGPAHVPVRVVGTREAPEWVAADVCAVLGIKNVRQNLAKFDPDEKGVCLTDTLGGPQEVATVTEPGLYRLIMRSRKPEARAFRRWVCHDVLPSLRAHGVYPPPPSVPMGLFGPIDAVGNTVAVARVPRPIAASVAPGETLIPLNAVRSIPWLPKSPGKRTAHWWHRYGRRGVYLETMRGPGGKLFTTESAVLTFLMRTAQPNPPALLANRPLNT